MYGQYHQSTSPVNQLNVSYYRVVGQLHLTSKFTANTVYMYLPECETEYVLSSASFLGPAYLSRGRAHRQLSARTSSLLEH